MPAQLIEVAPINASGTHSSMQQQLAVKGRRKKPTRNKRPRRHR